jgi:hypothetical protein
MRLSMTSLKRPLAIPFCHRTMLVVIKLDVAVEIIPQPIQPPVCFGVQLFNDLKDARQQVFSTRSKGRGDGAGVIRFDDPKGLVLTREPAASGPG